MESNGLSSITAIALCQTITGDVQIIDNLHHARNTSRYIQNQSRLRTVGHAAVEPDFTVVHFDPESDRALLLLPRYIVRQLPKITPSIASK